LPVINLICDSTEIERALLGLYKLVQANGAFVHDKLTLVSQQGEFRIMAAKDVLQTEKILILPKQCLLPEDKFTLGLEGKFITIKAHSKELSSAQVNMMEIMVTLYNLAGKLETQKRTSILSLHYEDRKLMEILFSSRSKESIAPFEEMVAQPKEDFFLDNFIKSRVLGYKVANNDPGKPYENFKVLMPIIDFLNHHPMAPGFIRRFDGVGNGSGYEDLDQGSVMILKYCPSPEHEECYVNYGPYDAMDTLLHYNYMEKSAGFVRSVPLTYRLPCGGTVNIRSAVGRVDIKHLPEQLEAIRFYIPGMTVDRDRKVVDLSFLYIPLGNAPRSMRRVLALALNQLGVDMADTERTNYIRLLEKHVIRENVKYYGELLNYLETCNPKPGVAQIIGNVREMAQHQLGIIQSYPFFAEALAMGET
jgi:hypothetical protein